MCSNITPIEKQVKCSRCGGVANPTDGWQNGWPLYGRISVGYPSDVTNVVSCGNSDSIAVMKNLIFHDASPQENSPQHLTFLWSHDGTYRMCIKCQERLIQLLGTFFRVS